MIRLIKAQGSQQSLQISKSTNLYNDSGGNLAMCLTSSKIYMFFVPAIPFQSLGPKEISNKYTEMSLHNAICITGLLNIWTQWSTNMIAYILCWISLSHFQKHCQISESLVLSETLGSIQLNTFFFLLRLVHEKGHHLLFLPHHIISGSCPFQLVAIEGEFERAKVFVLKWQSLLPSEWQVSRYLSQGPHVRSSCGSSSPSSAPVARGPLLSLFMPGSWWSAFLCWVLITWLKAGCLSRCPIDEKKTFNLNMPKWDGPFLGPAPSLSNLPFS